AKGRFGVRGAVLLGPSRQTRVLRFACARSDFNASQEAIRAALRALRTGTILHHSLSNVVQCGIHGQNGAAQEPAAKTAQPFSLFLLADRSRHHRRQWGFLASGPLLVLT